MKNLISNRQKHKAILFFQPLRNLALLYLRQMFCKFSAYCPCHDLRNSFHKLVLHKPRKEYLKRSFSYSEACVQKPPSPQRVGGVCTQATYSDAALLNSLCASGSKGI